MNRGAINEWAYCIFHPHSYRASTTHLRIRKSTERSIMIAMNIFIGVCLVGIGWYAQSGWTKYQNNKALREYIQNIQPAAKDVHEV